MPKFKTVADFNHKIANFACDEATLSFKKFETTDAKRIIEAFEKRQEKETQLKILIIESPAIKPDDIMVIIKGIQKLPKLLQTLETLKLEIATPLSEEISELLVNFAKRAPNLTTLEFNGSPEHKGLIDSILAPRKAALQHQAIDATAPATAAAPSPAAPSPTIVTRGTAALSRSESRSESLGQNAFVR